MDFQFITRRRIPWGVRKRLASIFSTKNRMPLVMLLVFLGFVAVTAKLSSVQLRGHSPVLRAKERDLDVLRGAIYDCNGRDNPLAVSVPARLYFIDGKWVNENHSLPELAERIAGVLDKPVDQILLKLKSPRQFQPIGIFEDNPDYDVMKAPTLFSGIRYQSSSLRRYPQKTRCAQVVGFVNRPNGPDQPLAGVCGLETLYNKELAGTPGTYRSLFDAKGREHFRHRKTIREPVHGANIFLTIDNNIQHIFETELEKARKEHKAALAWGVIQKVKTGEVLAMASCPAMDPATPDRLVKKNPRTDWQNLPVVIGYEPGSTMKTMTIAAALEEKLITPQTRFDVGRGSWYYEGTVLRDRVYGIVDVTTILQKSSNIGSARIGLMLADQSRSIKAGRFNAHETYLRLFGFGRRTGIDLGAEELGILRPATNWTKISPTRIAIGHEVSVTALQMVAAYSAIANGGLLMRPYIVERIEAADGTVLLRNEPKIASQPISTETAAKVRRMLERVTQPGGTATRAYVSGYSVAGKTGTAQMFENGAYSHTNFWVSFAGFCPAENAVFSMIVVLEKPRGENPGGGSVAAPVFASVTEQVARYLGLQPDQIKEEIEIFPGHNLWQDEQ